jgi:hypothetical protein
MSRTKKNTTLITVTAGFVGLMMLASAGLYLAGDGDSIRVESRSIQSDPGYTLDEGDLSVEDHFDPLSKADWDADLIDDYELADSVDLDRLQGNEVPEPATLGLLSMGGLAMLKRRRNRS